MHKTMFEVFFVLPNCLGDDVSQRVCALGAEPFKVRTSRTQK